MGEVWAALPYGAQVGIAFLCALFPLVLAHEFGHFIAAKLNGVRVDEFGFGFPPRLFRIAKVGDTEYTANALPIGGFVRLAGEDDPSVPGSFAGRGKAVRTSVLVAGPAANLVLAAAVLAGLAMVEPVPEHLPNVSGTTVVGVDQQSPADEAGLEPYDLIVAIDGRVLPRGSVDQGASHAGVVALQEAIAGSEGNALRLTVLRFAEYLGPQRRSDQVELRPADWPGVSGAEVVSAPEASSLRTGDVLLATEATVGDGPGAREPSVALRGVRALELTATPERDPADEKWEIGVSISAPVMPIRLGVPGAVSHGVKWTGSLAGMMVGALAEMIRGQRAVDLRGPLGISEISRQAIELGHVEFLTLMSLLSINLAIINLLPIPALDGGRLLFIAAEAARGRRVEPSREQLVHLIGLALVLALMVILTYFDWSRHLGGAVQ